MVYIGVYIYIYYTTYDDKYYQIYSIWALETKDHLVIWQSADGLMCACHHVLVSANVKFPCYCVSRQSSNILGWLHLYVAKELQENRQVIGRSSSIPMSNIRTDPLCKLWQEDAVIHR